MLAGGRTALQDAFRTFELPATRGRIGRHLPDPAFAGAFPFSWSRHPSQWCLKNWTARSCFSAASRVLNVPRFRLRPLLGSIFREYRRYAPVLSLRIIGDVTFSYRSCKPRSHDLISSS